MQRLTLRPNAMTLLTFALAAFLTNTSVAQDLNPESGVLFQCDFESTDWFHEWGLREAPKRVDTVIEDGEREFQSHSGKALRIRIDEGGHTGVSLPYRFAKQTGKEPEQIFFRYYIRLGNDWNPERGGKLPGIAGTYGKAGWGGRKVDGTNGWSARGLFQGQRNGHTPIGFYCYHADMRGTYGDNWIWEDSDFVGLENNRWYCIEQYAQLNTPGKRDGILRAWVDDRLVFEKTDVRMRDVEQLKIETVWINIYHGGTWSAKSDQHVFIDDVAIGSKRIGMKQGETPNPQS